MQSKAYDWCWGCLGASPPLTSLPPAQRRCLAAATSDGDALEPRWLSDQTAMPLTLSLPRAHMFYTYYCSEETMCFHFGTEEDAALCSVQNSSSECWEMFVVGKSVRAIAQLLPSPKTFPQTPFFSPLVNAPWEETRTCRIQYVPMLEHCF